MIRRVSSCEGCCSGVTGGVRMDLGTPLVDFQDNKSLVILGKKSLLNSAKEIWGNNFFAPSGISHVLMRILILSSLLSLSSSFDSVSGPSPVAKVPNRRARIAS
uniref:Uncharacterized protein n=1 Tax=Cacopsylla melanoneura TaxID=428564 RepID=A0A8D9AKT6_9HEMI